MEFSNTRFVIPSEYKERAIRVSSTDSLRMFLGFDWDFNAKSVRTNSTFGVFGIKLGNFFGGFDWYVRVLVSSNPHPETIRLVLLEYDKRNEIDQGSMNEVSFSEANILKTMTIEEFIVFVSMTMKEADVNHFISLFELSKKAAYFYGLDDVDEWVKIMIESYNEMYQRLETYYPMIKPVLERAKSVDMISKFQRLYMNCKIGVVSKKLIRNDILKL